MTKQDMLEMFKKLDEQKNQFKEDEFGLPLFDIFDRTERETEIDIIQQTYQKAAEMRG
jgi:hypothetical protein